MDDRRGGGAAGDGLALPPGIASGPAVTAGDLLWRAERCCRNAWPALRHVWLDDWLVNFSEGLTRRANSANPLRSDYHLRSAFVPACEALYQRRSLPAIFRIPTIVDMALDRRLEDKGYAREGESLVLYGAVSDIVAAPDPEVRLASRPAAEWFAAMAALQGHGPGERRIYRRIVGRVAVRAAFAILRAGDAPAAALAYGSLYDGLVCIESVVADRRQRRRGFARRVVSSLAAWGRAEGAEGICLEVDATNAAAIALYDGLGIGTELYRYHYRRRPPETG